MIRLATFALPFIRLLPPERAHELTLALLAAGAAPHRVQADDPILATSLWGRRFPNPVGLAAGFDKDARVADAMLRWGFGFVETGTVTPRPQPGNPRPRLFRLPEDEAIINRMGFNSEGLEAARARLAARRQVGVVGANLGKNRDAVDVEADYCRGVTTLAPLVDYLVINVSSPNTPGLRELQRKSAMASLIEAVLAARNAQGVKDPPPVLVKIAPDLSDEEVADLAAIALSTGIGGLIVSNTTTARPPTLRSADAPEPGGLSGKPLLEPSTRLLAEIYGLTRGKVPLIGVGGIASGADAYAKIRAGASLVQLYTALTYHGPALVQRIKRELAQCLRRDGFTTVAAAVGSGVTLMATGFDRQGA